MVDGNWQKQDTYIGVKGPDLDNPSHAINHSWSVLCRKFSKGTVNFKIVIIRKI